jgi:hypothetical protein
MDGDVLLPSGNESGQSRPVRSVSGEAKLERKQLIRNALVPISRSAVPGPMGGGRRVAQLVSSAGFVTSYDRMGGWARARKEMESE